MQQLTGDHLVVMGLAFLGTFLLVVVVGGAFIWYRTRQQANSVAPPPTPPPMTVDVVHSTADDHGRPEEALPFPLSPPPTRVAPARPPARPDPSAGVSGPIGIEVHPDDSTRPKVPEPRVTLTPVDERPTQRTHPSGTTTEQDATERIEVSTPTPKFLSPDQLADVDVDADGATVIIDRSKPDGMEYD